MSGGKNIINIRLAKKEDLGMLVNWGEKLYEAEKAFEPLLFYSRQESEDRYQKELENPDALFLIAEIDNKPAGYLYAHLDLIDYLSTKDKQCEIEVIFLEKEARGKGLSGILIEKCIDWAKPRGSFRIKAGIYTSNTASLNSFRKAGFEDYHITLHKNLL